MKEFLLRASGFGALMLSTCFAVDAQNIDGYFRVQNVSGIAADKGYVQVRGPFTAQPDQTFAQAAAEAGSVMYIKAVPEQREGETLYRIENLRSQGIEVVGEPIQDYAKTMQDILLSGDNLSDMNTALWAMVRGGFEHGYTSIGRATLQTMILMVASRLEEEGVAAQNELADFADRFNHEVADKINLSIYLEPVEGGYRLLYDVPDLQCVSEWYLKEENKATFEKGFESMRRYLLNRIGASGEYLDLAEIAEMQAWGYDPTAKYSNWEDMIDGRCLYVPYETIFADHELLFNWLKLNMIKFTDENRCPKIELKGFYLPDFAKELKEHALTAQLISYFPRLRTNERVYLTDGKNDVFGHFDFTSVEGAMALGEASKWQIKPVTAEDDACLYFDAEVVFEGKGYAAVYTDFPMQAVNPDITKLYNLSTETLTATINGVDYPYYEVEEMETVPARTPVLIEMEGDPMQNRILPVYTTVMPDINPEPDPVPDGFVVDDTVITEQRAPRRVAGGDVMPYFYGVLLPTTVNAQSFANQWGKTYDHEKTPVHTLTTRSGDVSALWMGQADENSSLRANQAILIKEPSVHSGYAIRMPVEDTQTGISVVEESQACPTVVYDLNGRQVNEMQPGVIYILNGKKIIAL